MWVLADMGVWESLRAGWQVLLVNLDALIMAPLRYPILSRSL